MAEFRANSPHRTQTRAMPCRHVPPWRLRFGPSMRLRSLPLLIGILPASLWAADDDRFAALPEAVARVERETGGKVLQVRPIQRGDREVFRMKVLTPEGRVKIVLDDPKRNRNRRDDANEDRERAEREPDPEDHRR